VDKVKAIHFFPRDFKWGTATSSHQVEGGNSNNDWWQWEAEPGRILRGHRSAEACDWWGGRWEEDLDRAVESGQNAHRLSVEWSRIEPSPGVWDEGALDHYRQLTKGAVERGLEPMVTLHHFTNPLWFAEQGGWLDPDSVVQFERYSRVVVSSLKDFVTSWITINEPNVLIYFSYIDGNFPPGVTNIASAFTAAEHMARSHAAAYRAIHEIQGGARVGIAHHFRAMRPARQGNPIDRWLTKFRSRTFNDLFPRILGEGWLRLFGRRVHLPEALKTQDFFGLNYYTMEKVGLDLRKPKEAFSRGFFPKDADLSPTGFIANEPDGMWDALKFAQSYKLPIIVTENGVEDAADQFRPRYLAEHLRKIWAAANFNWKVEGYYHWTLVDNFEWDRGWTQRFGLWSLDPETQIRTKRRSADFYSEVCHANALSSEMVLKYAPEVLDSMFPGGGQREFVSL
jgi:beta-glucosidase